MMFLKLLNKQLTEQEVPSCSVKQRGLGGEEGGGVPPTPVNNAMHC